MRTKLFFLIFFFPLLLGLLPSPLGEGLGVRWAEVAAQNTRLWATYYGGSGSEEDCRVATDGIGNVYLAGSTGSTSGISSGGFQNTYGGGFFDALLVKFDGGGNRLWATYYGGSGVDKASSVATDGTGNVYLAGYTNSTSGIASGGFQNIYGFGYDAFLVKFDAATGNRLWATYYGSGGGFAGNDIGMNVAADGTGNVYLAGTTRSGNMSSGGFQNIYGGGFSDAFLAKFDAATGNRLWATYYGGSKADDGLSVAADASGNVYLAGSTNSTSGIASGGFQNIHGGAYSDAFLVSFDAATGNRLWATYYGGSDFDYGSSVISDGFGNVYLAGSTNSTSGIASGGFQNIFGGNTDAFLVKFDAATGNRHWATYYGGIDMDEWGNVATDAAGNVYLGGDTYSPGGIASGGFQNNLVGIENEFVVKFDPGGSRLCATYYGQVHEEDGHIAIDGLGNVYLAGFAQSTSGIASGGFQNNFGGGGFDGYLVKFTSCGSIFAAVSSTPIQCKGQCTGTATANSANGTDPYTYLWNTGGQTTQTVTGLCAGNYTVTVADGFGSTVTATVTITEPNAPCPCADLAVPNAFSPNSDGENDEFCLQGDIGDCIEKLNISIYDRWGEEIYKSNDPKFCWNATYRANKLNTAVFVYYLDVRLISGAQITKRGNVSLLR